MRRSAFSFTASDEVKLTLMIGRPKLVRLGGPATASGEGPALQSVKDVKRLE